MNKDDSEKIRRLYELYEQPMYRIAFAVLKSPETAEDAVSEAFLRLIRHIGRIKDPGSEDTRRYIVKVIRSAAITQYRMLKKSMERERSADDETLQIPDSRQDIEEAVIGRDSADSVLRRLSDEDRQLVELRCVEGLSWHEAAGRLGIAEAAARKRFERAKKRLSEILKKKENDL
ncbi:MAG: sigma-70 family RNA polymerase sigma factor [Ruminococcus sp.]|nr:sigma-70 family RNA polymerase sigma factor [Ruminococcus sp.]